MTTNLPSVNPRAAAVLKNVAACMTVVDNLRERPFGLSGFGVFSGYSGYGKSMAAQYVQNKRKALFLEVRSWWTQRFFCEALLMELGVAQPRGTIAHMMVRITEMLSEDPSRPLIIDEADRLVDKKMIELVRDLHQDSRIPILLVGEELLPQKLRTIERIYNRVLVWELAQPCDMADAKLLVGKWCPEIAVAEDLLEAIIRQTEGNARKIAATLHKAKGWAQNSGLSVLEAGSYGGGFFTGEAPSRKRA